MENVTHIGLDVHKDSIAVATLRPGALTCDERTIANTPEAIRRLFSRFADPSSLSACYEAGPTGYDTYRLLTSLGVACEVIAPALVPRRAGLRVKTDRLDARNLARLHRACELTPVRVPTPAEEALRDLIRLREDLKADRRIARQRIRSFLLRHGRVYPKGRGNWTRPYLQWLSTQEFGESAADATYRHLLAAHAVRASQLDSLDAEIAAAAARDPLALPVARLRCFRGLDTLSAATIVAETCDFRRFPTAASFMAFTGLVPSEHSSGASMRHGSITKTGNRHIRRVLVEAAWSYRHRPAVGRELAQRLAGCSPEVAAYSWAAQCRLHATYRKLAISKGHNKAVVAVARELAGFAWGLMNDRIAV
jgi:transposase